MIPIHRGRKLDSDEWIEGLYLGNRDVHVIATSYSPDSTDSWGEQVYTTKVDPDTLQISFDDGKSWLILADLEVYTSLDFRFEYMDTKLRKKKIIQPANGSIFTVITDKGR